MRTKTGLYISIGLFLFLAFVFVSWRKGWFSGPKMDNIKPGVFNPKNEAIRLHQMLSSWSPDSSLTKKAFELILDYSDIELIDVINQYSQKYSGDTYPTLRALVQGEWTVLNSTILLQQEVITRLTDIGA